MNTQTIAPIDTAAALPLDLAGAPAERAIPKGYTEFVSAVGGCHELRLAVVPGADLDGTFKAWCLDEQEFIRVNGWNFSITDLPADEVAQLVGA